MDTSVYSDLKPGTVTFNVGQVIGNKSEYTLVSIILRIQVFITVGTSKLNT
jgi:hypothetical protein